MTVGSLWCSGNRFWDSGEPKKGLGEPRGPEAWLEYAFLLKQVRTPSGKRGWGKNKHGCGFVPAQARGHKDRALGLDSLVQTLNNRVTIWSMAIWAGP